MKLYRDLYDRMFNQFPSEEDIESICQQAVSSWEYMELSEKEKEKADKVIRYLCTRPRGRRPTVSESVEAVFMKVLG